MKTVTVIGWSSTYKTNELHQAIVKTMKALPFESKGILFTKDKPSDMILPNLKWISYPHGGKDQAGYFQMWELNQYINTDLTISVQWDGFAINPHNWNNAFLDYDYIGAPFHENPISQYFIPRFRHRVGCGAFALRSKKWLELCTKARNYLGESEDMFCTQSNRNHFVKNGCLIAPVEVAGRFAVEWPLPSWPDIHIDKAFGFHGYLENGQPRFYGKPPKLWLWGSIPRVSKRIISRIIGRRLKQYE
jgi:hypothetical protein